MRLVQFSHAAPAHFLPLPTFEKSICYKFKIIIGQKGNNL